MTDIHLWIIGGILFACVLIILAMVIPRRQDDDNDPYTGDKF